LASALPRGRRRAAAALPQFLNTAALDLRHFIAM
jgi:hypothetical protein